MESPEKDVCFDISDVEPHIRHVREVLHRYFKSQVGIFRAGGDFVSIPSVDLSIKTVIYDADHRVFIWSQGRSACAVAKSAGSGAS